MEYTEFKVKIIPLEVGREVLIAELSEIGFESFVETDFGIEAYISSADFNINDIKKLKVLNNPEFEISYSIQTIEDQNWNEEWEKSFNLINVENTCCIRAPFHDKIDNIEYDIIISPKMSFGTGHHETTYLMIKRLLGLNIKNMNVLDMGCGTGVLAILSKMKNAKYVEAIDIDEWAYKNTLENIRNNNCTDIKVKLGGAELLGKVKYDCVMANINRNILLTDMKKYVKSMSEKGLLLLSGFFGSDIDVLLNEASKYQLEMVYTERKNDWAILHFLKR